MRTRRVRLGDVELSCNEIEGEGRAFVLLHGLTGHRHDFRARLPELADLGWLLVPDLRGHGDFTQTGRDETFVLSQLVADLLAFLDVEGIEACDLLGHSFGGMLALRFVLEHPERVASLVLMDTSPFAPDGYTRAVFAKAGAIARARGMEFLQRAVENAARANSSPSASDRQTRKWADAYWPHHRLRYTSMDPVAYAALTLCMLEQASVEHRLGEIACPTSVLVGCDDLEFLRGSDALQAGISGAVRVTIPDAGHHPHMENPEAWSAAVREHLARVRV
ncbi:MAG: alpha/beta hydrolase [Deltaproteobacteria bacterium]|nr:alpha/beta hydrolase [Deltaproteobacteria bacterium]MBW2360606.1 alpha/beta hydrolase [Deltaproteobacteria bacterium]